MVDCLNSRSLSGHIKSLRLCGYFFKLRVDLLRVVELDISIKVSGHRSWQNPSINTLFCSFEVVRKIYVLMFYLVQNFGQVLFNVSLAVKRRPATALEQFCTCLLCL